MNETDLPSERLQALVDEYLNGQLDEAGIQDLESLLAADATARRYFMRYAGMDTDLHLELRARDASRRALLAIEQSDSGGVSLSDTTQSVNPPLMQRTGLWSLPRFVLAAAVVLIAVGTAAWLRNTLTVNADADREQAVAWLVNAQDCQWTGRTTGSGPMRPGHVLRLARGLAEVRFACGATALLEGPAEFELLSGKSARLLRGRLTAHVPREASGFEVLSPQGKVIDLGTEFGIRVADSGVTDLFVFDGKVEAHASSQSRPEHSGVSVTRNQSARIASGKVTLQPEQATEVAEQFIRSIVPPRLVQPRTMLLTFDRAIDQTLGDSAGAGTGLTHRLPGTGAWLPSLDPNIVLKVRDAQLELTTTDSDINTQYKLRRGEYLGVRLADLGFSGTEDFTVTVTIPNIPALELVGQFGLYAGPRSDRNIRGGVICSGPGEYTQFLVNNCDGRDTDFNRVGILSTGADVRLVLKRAAGRYSLTMENLSSGGTSALTIRHPEFLDDQPDLYVGVFAANTQSDVRQTIVIKQFQATVWTVSTPATP